MADILFEEVSATIPGGPTAYKLAKLGVKHAKNYIKDRTEDRLIEFHRFLLEGLPESERKNFSSRTFSKEDYYNLLNAVIQDQESEKIEIYSNLFQGIILGAIPQKYKSHLIKTIRDLSLSDLELMKTLYIRSIKDQSLVRTSLDEKQTSENFTEAYSFQTLLRLGFLAPSSNNVIPFLITDLLRFTVEFFYDIDLDKLTPVYKKPLRVFLAYDKFGADNNDLFNIMTTLQNEGINTVCALPLRMSLPLLIAPIIVLCLKRQSNLLDTIKKFVPIENKEIIQLILPGGELDALPYPKEDYFDLRSPSNEELNRLISHVKDKSKLNHDTLVAYSKKVRKYNSFLQF